MGDMQDLLLRLLDRIDTEITDAVDDASALAELRLYVSQIRDLVKPDPDKGPVMRVGDYCQALWQWLDLVEAQAKSDEKARLDAALAGRSLTREPDKNFVAIAEIAPALRLAITKSNYLARRIYVGEEHRTEPCPIHKGRWSGYAHGAYSSVNHVCPAGCSQGVYDITGWLPAGKDARKCRECGHWKQQHVVTIDMRTEERIKSAACAAEGCECKQDAWSKP
jgi:hypothetical protein